MGLTLPLTGLGLRAEPAPAVQFRGDAYDPAFAFVPPSGHGTAGPHHLVLSDNGKLIVQSKSGVVVSSQTLLNFWDAALPAADFRSTAWPRIHFDPITQRYIATALGTTSNRVVIRVSPPQFFALVAVSETDDPTGPWKKYAFNLNTDAASPLRPVIGVNVTQTGFSHRWIALTLVATNLGAADGCHLYVFEKNDLINNAVTPTTVTRFGKVANNPVSPMVPNLNTAQDDLYFLESRFGDGGIFYSLGEVTDKGGPVLGAVSSRNIATPYLHLPSTFPFHPQSGTSDKISASKSEIQSLIFDGTSLWSAQTVYGLSPTRSAIQWHHWNPVNLADFDAGVLEDLTGANMYDYPSLSVTPLGDVLIGFTRFSGTTFPSAGYAFRAANDPAGTLQKPEIYKVGLAPYHPLGAGANPWGYFSTTALDPSDGHSLWTLQNYAEAPVFNGDTFDDAWGLQWARAIPPVNAPTMLAPAALGVSSVQWNWSDNSHNETGFNLRRTADNGAIVLALAANTTFYRQTGLTPNAAQRAYAQAFNSATTVNGGNSSVIYTLANPPTGTAVTIRSSNTATLAWNANGNPAGTEYRLQGATSVPLLALASESTTTATTISFNTLTPDTTWFFRVRARNANGVNSAFDATVSTLTLPAPPAAPSAPDAVARSTGSLTWGWTDLAANEAGFRVRRASDSVVLIGTLPANSAQWLQTGLTPNAPQRVFAESFNVTASSASGFSPTRYTLATAPVASTVAIVAPQTARFTWLANGNPAGTVYQVSFAQSGFDPSFFSTTGTFRNFPGLTPNTTYEFQASAQNAEGIFSAPSALLTLWIPSLTPNAPSAVTAVAFSTHSVSWAWTDNANNEDGFRVRRSSDNLNLSGDLPVNSTGFVHVGLGPNAPAQVRAESFNATGSSASAPSATAYSLAAPPSSLAFLGVFPTSASFGWSNGGNPGGTLFRAERSLNGAAYVEIATTTLTSALAPALAPDTTYFFRVRAENTEGTTTAYSNVVTTRTIPLAPLAPSLFVIDESTVSITWGWTDNAANETGYRVRRTTDNASLSGDLPAGTASFLQTGLSPNRSQQIYVEAFNAGGTGASGSLAHFTDAAQPDVPAAAPTVSTVLLTWPANGNPPGTVYESQFGASVETYGAALSSTATARLFTGLAENTTYFFRVWAVNGDENPTGYSGVSARTALGPPAAPSVPVVIDRSTGSLRWGWTDNATNEASYRFFARIGASDQDLSGPLSPNTTFYMDTDFPTANAPRRAFVRASNATGDADSGLSPVAYTLANPPTGSAVSIYVSSVTLRWNANGNPLGTVYRAEKAFGPGDFEEFQSGSSLEATAVGLATGPYRFRVRAENGDERLTAYDAVIQASVTVPNVFSVCSDGGAFSYGATNVIVPPGSATCGTVFTVLNPGTFPNGTGPTGTLTPLGVGADISAVPPVCGFSVTLSYADADVAGIDESTLVIARYDGARGFWVPLPSRVEATTNKVTAAQACTSLVQVMGRAPSNTVSTAVAYPVPARTQITFSNLPAAARIQIYTVSAEKVREFDADSGGQAVWDLRNESGETVASGTYLARIEKSGQDDVVKVVVQR